MNVLIAKLGATGDVVRTTTLLNRFSGHVTWITAPINTPLLSGIYGDLRCLAWSDRNMASDRHYDLVINLEDTLDVAQFVNSVSYHQLYGAYADSRDSLRYSDDSRAWFDLSLISAYGRQEADRLKLQNRQTYQELIFSGLGFKFSADPYHLPKAPASDLSGDVAVAREAGPVWPMKNWAFYDDLIAALKKDGLRVNVLPRRPTLLEHYADVRSHKCVVGGDSLPMHFALGSETQCVSIFNCTSPWEICDYGFLSKIVSPLLSEFFYKRTFDERATTAVTLETVYKAVRYRLERAPSAT